MACTAPSNAVRVLLLSTQRVHAFFLSDVLPPRVVLSLSRSIGNLHRRDSPRSLCLDLSAFGLFLRDDDLRPICWIDDRLV